MISADFYPTAIQFDAPSYAPTFHLTDKIMACDPDAFSNYYWLGWLSWDNFPDCWKLSGYTLTNTELIFNIATQPQNINIGYASKYGGTSGGNNIYPECYHASPLVNVGSPSARYINKLDVMGVGNSGVVFGWHCTYIYGAGDSLTNRGYNDGSFRLSGKSLYDFLYGDTTRTIQLATGISYELDFDNMEEDGSFHFTTTYNDNNFDFVVSFSYCAPLNMRNVSSTSPAGTQNVNAYPMYSLTMDGDIYSFMATDAAFYHPSGYPCCIIDKSTQQPISDTSAGNIIGDYIANGLECTIPKAFITSSPSYSRLITGNAHVFNRGSDIAVYRMLTRSEMQKIVGLSLRQSDGTYNTYGYQNELSYAPYVTEDNEFTATLITGDLSDDEFKAKLRPWQYDVEEWSENDYTEEDLPPYKPEPEPGPGGEPDEGDRGVPIPKFGNVPGQTEFVHYAVMSPFAINELATQLWDQPDSFWQKIVAATSENPMDYFISLRYYPLQFDKGDGKSDMYIGRGGELHFANNYYPIFPVEQFNCGSITIARQYNNFLDYAPYTSISVFLPFAGTFELNPTIVMGRTISLWLSVDVSDGSAIWEVYNETDHQPVLIKQCRMAAEIPLSGLDASQMASNVINASLQTAQHALGSVTTDLNSRAGVAAQALGGNGKGATSGAISTAFNGPQAILTGLGDAYNLAQASKEIPQYTGGSSGAAACGMNHTPYIVYRRPLCTNPSNFAHAVGYLSNKTAAISTLSGFTSCRNVDVSGIDQATDTEKAQIKQILESGFYA